MFESSTGPVYLPETLKIFSPLRYVKEDSPVGGVIITWGIGEARLMLPVIHLLVSKWTIIIGYSKQTHNLGKLVNITGDWQKSLTDNASIEFRWLPNCHIKLWQVGESWQGDYWAGSANLVQNTLANAMFHVTRYPAEAVIHDVLGASRALGPGVDLNDLKPLTAPKPDMGIEYCYHDRNEGRYA